VYTICVSGTGYMKMNSEVAVKALVSYDAYALASAQTPPMLL